MKDVTGLERIDADFTDKFDIGQTKPSISRKAKEIKFLDKFGDSGQIGKNEEWDISENEFMVSEKRSIKTRNRP